jgi:hypothetical protein
MKADLKELYQEKFNSENRDHRNMLIQVWEKLKGNTDIELIDKKWRTHMLTHSRNRLPSCRPDN